jgi:hypothetical protein
MLIERIYVRQSKWTLEANNSSYRYTICVVRFCERHLPIQSYPPKIGMQRAFSSPKIYHTFFLVHAISLPIFARQYILMRNREKYDKKISIRSYIFIKYTIHVYVKFSTMENLQKHNIYFGLCSILLGKIWECA